MKYNSPVRNFLDSNVNLNPAFVDFLDNAGLSTPQLDEDMIDLGMYDDPQDYDGYYPQKTREPSSTNFVFPSFDGTCPKCGSKMVLKNGRFGDFYGCSSFPDCRYTCSVKQFEASIKEKEEPQKKKTLTGLCNEIEYKGCVYSDPFGLRCGDCSLYLHGKKSCVYREWLDVEPERPACDMFVSKDLNERLSLLKFLKRIREEMKKHEC